MLPSTTFLCIDQAGITDRCTGIPRGERGEARNEEAGPLPGDGFMGESPAPPRRGPLMLTPLQESQRRRADQVSQIRIHKQMHAGICLATELGTMEKTRR